MIFMPERRTLYSTMEAEFEPESPQSLSFSAPNYMFYSSTAADLLLNGEVNKSVDEE